MTHLSPFFLFFLALSLSLSLLSPCCECAKEGGSLLVGTSAVDRRVVQLAIPGWQGEKNASIIHAVWLRGQAEKNKILTTSTLSFDAGKATIAVDCISTAFDEECGGWRTPAVLSWLAVSGGDGLSEAGVQSLLLRFPPSTSFGGGMKASIDRKWRAGLERFVASFSSLPSCLPPSLIAAHHTTDTMYVLHARYGLNRQPCPTSNFTFSPVASSTSFSLFLPHRELTCQTVEEAPLTYDVEDMLVLPIHRSADVVGAYRVAEVEEGKLGSELHMWETGAFSTLSSQQFLFCQVSASTRQDFVRVEPSPSSLFLLSHYSARVQMGPREVRLLSFPLLSTTAHVSFRLTAAPSQPSLPFSISFPPLDTSVRSLSSPTFATVTIEEEADRLQIDVAERQGSSVQVEVEAFESPRLPAVPFYTPMLVQGSVEQCWRSDDQQRLLPSISILLSCSASADGSIVLSASSFLPLLDMHTADTVTANCSSSTTSDIQSVFFDNTLPSYVCITNASTAGSGTVRFSLYPTRDEAASARPFIDDLTAIAPARDPSFLHSMGWIEQNYAASVEGATEVSPTLSYAAGSGVYCAHFFASSLSTIVVYFRDGYGNRLYECVDTTRVVVEGNVTYWRKAEVGSDVAATFVSDKFTAELEPESQHSPFCKFTFAPFSVLPFSSMSYFDKVGGDITVVVEVDGTGVAGSPFSYTTAPALVYMNESIDVNRTVTHVRDCVTTMTPRYPFYTLVSLTLTCNAPGGVNIAVAGSVEEPLPQLKDAEWTVEAFVASSTVLHHWLLPSLLPRPFCMCISKIGGQNCGPPPYLNITSTTQPFCSYHAGVSRAEHFRPHTIVAIPAEETSGRAFFAEKSSDEGGVDSSFFYHLRSPACIGQVEVNIYNGDTSSLSGLSSLSSLSSLPPVGTLVLNATQQEGSIRVDPSVVQFLMEITASSPASCANESVVYVYFSPSGEAHPRLPWPSAASTTPSPAAGSTSENNSLVSYSALPSVSMCSIKSGRRGEHHVFVAEEGDDDSNVLVNQTTSEGSAAVYIFSCPSNSELSLSSYFASCSYLSSTKGGGQITTVDGIIGSSVFIVAVGSFEADWESEVCILRSDRYNNVGEMKRARYSTVFESSSPGHLVFRSVPLLPLISFSVRVHGNGVAAVRAYGEEATALASEGFQITQDVVSSPLMLIIVPNTTYLDGMGADPTVRIELDFE